MTESGRRAYLMARKAQIEAELKHESSSHYPDTLRLTALKRRKLLLKEELEKTA